jgi:hypothetical protein
MVFDNKSDNINLDDYDIESLKEKSPSRIKKVINKDDSDFENQGRASSRLRKLPKKFSQTVVGPNKRPRKAGGKDESVFDLIMKWKPKEELAKMPGKKIEDKS